mgnify:CR=1 FL=1
MFPVLARGNPRSYNHTSNDSFQVLPQDVVVRLQPAAGDDRIRRVRELRSALDVPDHLKLLSRRLQLLHRVYMTTLNSYFFGSSLSMLGIIIVCALVHTELFGPSGLL